MSNVGQGALIIVGTVVGAYFGNPQLGFVLGSLAGNALFPTQLPGQSGPRIQDNQTTTSVVGTPVSILFGTASLAGTFMWLAKIVETTNTQHVGGKGGPTQTNTTYSYTQSVAVGLCEGPIGGILRIWENGMLVYDIRAQLPLETDTNYANRLTVAAIYAETFTLHLGTDDQMPDATIEAVQGIGNVPGFRGLAYIVFPQRKLQEAQALRHPSFKFEVFDTGSLSCVTQGQVSNEVLYPWHAPGSIDPRDLGNIYSYQFVSRNAGGASTGPIRDTLNAVLLDGVLPNTCYGWNVTGVGNYSPWQALSTTDNEQTLRMFFNTKTPASMTTVPVTPPEDICTWADAHPSGYWTGEWVDGSGFHHQLNHGVFYYGGTPGFIIGGCGPSGTLGMTVDDEIEVTRYPGSPPDPCVTLPPAPVAGYCIRGDGKYIKGGPWLLDSSRSFKILAPYALISADGSGRNGIITQHPLNPCLPPGSADDNSTFWTAAYNAAMTAGKIASGKVYGVDYPVPQGFAWTSDLTICDGTTSKVSIGDIIRAICARCKLTDVDASDMDTIYVDGYSVSTVAAGRDILTPLRSVGFFDCVESGSTLKFIARGKPIVASLTADDFGAFDSGANPTPGPSITTVKAQDADLPLQTRVHYLATSRDYEAGEQLSPTRLTTTAVNVVDVELAVCMNDTQAAKIADVIWSDAWAERWSGTLAVDQAWSELEPGDNIEVPVDGVTRRIRIINETVASGVLRTFNYVRDDDGAYVSHAVATAPIRQTQQVRLMSPTDLELLDLPALLDSDNDAGFYAAARGTAAGNSWGGCVIFRSADGGATFAQLASITTASTMGTLQSAVTASDWHTWDDVTTITVNVDAGLSFESRADAAVLTGANSAAMGANGRWEIVQFANATQLSPTQWRLSRLLRGRRGTEHNIDSSQAGDKFIMISTGGIARLPLQTAEIGAARIYKAVSIGASYASGIDQTFAGQGVALRPFSPVLLTAERDTAGDIVLHWTRRGRLGRTLMSGVDIPLSEATEAYQVDIYRPDSPHTVVRVLSVTTTTAIYTAAQQSTDFGSDSSTHIMVAVYQMSALVGRGTPDFQLLTIS